MNHSHQRRANSHALEPVVRTRRPFGAFVHTKQRVLLRYDEQISFEDWDNWTTNIEQNKDSVELIECLHAGNIWAVFHNGKNIFVLVKNGVVVTALPKTCVA